MKYAANEKQSIQVLYDGVNTRFDVDQVLELSHQNQFE